MQTLRTMRALWAFDRGSVLGDPLLRGLALVPLMAALAIRGLLPLVAGRVGALAGVELGWIVQPLSAYAAVGIAPLIAGAVAGFLLLDQRDDRTLLALRVTPMPLGAYLAYRLAAPTLVAWLATLAALAIGGGFGLGLAAVLLAALAAAPLAPVAALALAAFARNKVQGAALMKAASIFVIAPLAGLFLPTSWGALLAALPTTWVAWAVWELQAGRGAWAFIAGAWCVSAALLPALLWRLRRALAAG